MAQPERPTLVVVSGPPATGKTTLAHALAQAIRCPAVVRDELKEGLVHAHGSGYSPAPGDPLTRRASELFFDVLRLLLEAGVTTVAEASFQDPLWRRGLEPLDGLAELRVVQCFLAPAAARERAARRSADEARTRVHGDSTAGKALEDWAAALASFERLSLSVPSLDVDTTDGYEPDLAAILEFVGRR